MRFLSCCTPLYDGYFLGEVMAVVEATAKNLRSRLIDYEQLHIDDLKAWLAEERMEGPEGNSIIGHGMTKTKKWWHRPVLLMPIGIDLHVGASCPNTLGS